MVPGVGLFYSGLLRRKNALSMIFFSMAAIGVATFQWFFWGFSLAFADNASSFIGTLRYFCLKGVLDQPSMGSTRIPSLLFAFFQGMFAIITVALVIGGFAERSRVGPVLLFMFCWLTIVYCPIACWTWNANGWAFQHGDLDFAGGTPVHISSGTATLAIALYLGKRRGYGTERLAYKPHNTTYVVLGTVFLWFGWFGFNGGSALSANLRAVQACIVTNVAASVGAITWMLMDWRLERKYSAVGFCSGAISGLVGITPAAGFVGTPSAVAIGFVTAVACNFGTRLKHIVRIDEALDVFATHGIGGYVGCILTALFADGRVTGFDGFSVGDGWFNHNWVQLGWNLAAGTAGMSYSFVVTSILCWMFHFVPGLCLRSEEDCEIVGIDDAYLGEYAYDYVGADPELRIHRLTAVEDLPPVMERNGSMEGTRIEPPNAEKTTSEPSV